MRKVVVVIYSLTFSDFLTLHNIIMALVENGAHMDTVNQLGATPFDSATTGIPNHMFIAYGKILLCYQSSLHSSFFITCKTMPLVLISFLAK